MNYVSAETETSMVKFVGHEYDLQDKANWKLEKFSINMVNCTEAVSILESFICVQCSKFENQHQNGN